MSLKKIALIIIGLIALILGTVGIILPVLPTTPFILLAAGCFSASSEKLSQQLSNNRIFGFYIENYHSKEGIPRRLKYRAILFLWLSLILSMVLTKKLPLIIILTIVGIAVTIHLITIKNKD